MKDCPTDVKISQLRGGVKEQNKVIQIARDKCRVAAGMSGVRGFSLISADPNKTRLGKRSRMNGNDSGSAGNAYSTKRVSF